MSSDPKIDIPRYTSRPFPTYRYLPFQGRSSKPHPRNDPGGHSYDEEEEYLPHFIAEHWNDCELFLYGVDLFNHGYWWEAHEAWEAVWLAAGQKKTVCGRFVQGLIQLSGAQLKRFIGEMRGARSLTSAGCEKLSEIEGRYLGIHVAELIAEAKRCLSENCGEFPSIELEI